jgi:hypothetical protein
VVCRSLPYQPCLRPAYHWHGLERQISMAHQRGPLWHLVVWLIDRCGSQGWAYCARVMLSLVTIAFLLVLFIISMRLIPA